MSAIGPGDFVICVEDASGRPDGLPGPSPIVGRVYLVEEVVSGDWFADGEPAFVLFEIKGNDVHGNRSAFWFDIFRPFQGPEQEPVKVSERVPAGAFQ